ncbi:MAG: Crp/Fnr family transcriptional regulator [Chloroflexota bacterium]
MQYQFPIFENLCPSWGNFTHLGIKRFFLKGSQVFDIVNPIHGVYYVKKGEVEVILHTLHGPEKVLYYVGQGCIFGEVSCFVAGDSGEARVIARTDSECFFFPKEIIENQLAETHPKLLLELIQAEAYKIRMYGVLLQDSLNNNNFERVCKMLVYLVRYKMGENRLSDSKILINPGLSQIDMARLMGLHRVTVTKAISRLKKLGILDTYSKKSLIITDFPALIGLSESE